MQLRLLIFLVACSREAAQPQATPAPSGPIVSTEECNSLAAMRKARCGTEEAKAYAQCISYVDLVDKTGCRREARASYDCGRASVAGCTTPDCCASSVRTCDPIDIKFTDCVAAHCKAHPGGSECQYIPE
jgi:hypothetical protein